MADLHLNEKMGPMQRFWSKLAVELGKHAGIVALTGLLITLIAGYGLTKLQFATGQDSYLNSDDQVYIDNVQYQSLFGGQAMLVLVQATDGRNINDLVSAQNQEAYAKIAQQLEARPDLIESVVTPQTALQWSDALIQRSAADPNTVAASPTESIAGAALLKAQTEAPTPADADARLKDATETLGKLNAIAPDQRVLSNPEWTNFLLFDNQGEIRKPLQAVFVGKDKAQIIVRLKGNADIETEGKGAVLVQDVIEANPIQGADTTVTGASILLKQINDYLKGGMLTLGAIALVIMAMILIFLFDVRWRLLPLGVIIIGVTWAFGLAGYLGIPLSLVTIAGLPVMLGVGIDYAIQMHARVEEEVVIDRADHPIQETARNLGPALLVVTFDAIFAFAALRFAKVPMIRAFGLLLAVGIAVICLNSIIFPLAALGIREYKSPTKGRDFREGALGRLAVKLGSLPKTAGAVLAVACLGIFAVGIVLEDKLVLQTDPVQWVDQNSQGIKDFRKVEAAAGAGSELGVFIKTDDPEKIFDQQTVDYVWKYANEWQQKFPEQLLTPSSTVTTVGFLLDVPGAAPATPDAKTVQLAYEVAPPGIQRSTVNPPQGAMNLVYRYGKGSLEERAKVVDQIEAGTNPPPGMTVVPSGLAVVGVGLLRNLEANRVLLTYLAIAFVGIFLAFRLRSIVRSLLSLVPVMIAVGMASIVAYVFNLKLSPMTAVGGPLVVAACTEFTSLILLRFIEERKRGYAPREAVDVAAARTGRAFIVSGLTAISGVAVIATSSLPLLRDFGLVVGMNVAVALLSALVVLPPLLVWADNKGHVSKGMIPDETLRLTTPGLGGHSVVTEVPEGGATTVTHVPTPEDPDPASAG